MSPDISLAFGSALLDGDDPVRLHPLPWALPVPLRVHGHYNRAEIEAAFGLLTDHAPWIHREGVLWHEPSQCDLLFVTLRTSKALFSPTTRYRYLALGSSLFHWESQSTTSAASATGQWYVHHEARGSRVLLFVREQRKQGGVTESFVCLGFARYKSHEGERIWFVPAIRWRLEREIPAAWLPGCCLAWRRRWRFEGARRSDVSRIASDWPEFAPQDRPWPM